MSTFCTTSCGATDARVPVRATYVNLYKWPDSDAEFVRSVSTKGLRNGGDGSRPRVVDSISCRQLYLRSYTFSRKERVPEKTRKWLARVKEKVLVIHRRRKGKNKSSACGGGGGGRKLVVRVMRAKRVSCATLSAVFRRFLSCTRSTKVDVVE
ncbi:uncharacterized protein LOC127788342 [Diospyros lotus]|uniref:uncharacterized protein LOC127788342 n=1 Tax=Diospyros lotus TaxID=55363 RepID=UPI0022539E2E|nr:uncharacterized protein LOC127788342 [Diospyros lotus]